ncbi:MAG: choice-of-anchor J domain-containing protein [Flavobacteriaceae bacterium]|jgi:gliding motility-associated-like protein|nr:choice-of-anchor J domain-containing protein [Flavobacteriaceae bacterium]
MKKILLVVFFVISCSFILFAINGVETVGIDQMFVVKEATVQKDKNKGGNKIKASSSTCTPLALPFEEDFRRLSTTQDCWTMYDLNKNGTGTKGRWILDPDSSNMRITTNSKNEDDWLISPPLISTGKYVVVELVSSVQTLPTDKDNLHIYLSTTGNQPQDFKTVVYNCNVLEDDSKTITQYSFFVPNGTFYFGIHTNKGKEFSSSFWKVVVRENECIEAINPTIKGIHKNQVLLNIEDNISSSWDYVIQEKGGSQPTIKQATTNVLSNVVLTDAKGNLFKSDTEYELYIRGNCINGMKSTWNGPFNFRTQCPPISVFPFFESFDTSLSSSVSCWQLNSSIKPAQYDWIINVVNGVVKTSVAHLYNSNFKNVKPLVSPIFDFGTDPNSIYELSFYFKSRQENPYKLYMSTDGIDYIEVVGATKEKQDDGYKKETYFLKNVSGLVNFAWKIDNTETYQNISIDDVKIEKVDCVGISIDDIKVKALASSNVDVEWKDVNNQSWEYYVQVSGNNLLPTTIGTPTNTKNVVITTDSNTGKNLQSNTMYDFYVRTKCSNGAFGAWNGPIRFKTYCAVVSLPFWEGFNTGSPTLDCWRNSEDTIGETKSIGLSTYEKYEGTHGLELYSYSKVTNFISPSFHLDSKKIYRLKYNYRNTRSESFYMTSTYYGRYSVKVSTQGIKESNFTKVLQSNSKAVSFNWKQEVIVFTGVGGDVNIGWFIEDEKTPLAFDNVFLEELPCAEPFDLFVEDVKYNAFEFGWKDDIATKWEYIVQAKGGGIPQKKGLMTSLKRNKIIKDDKGNLITPFTEYDLYVRSNCGGSNYGNWIGPYSIRTACNILQIPFWEGFNEEDSQTLACWKIYNNRLDTKLIDNYQSFWKPIDIRYWSGWNWHLQFFDSYEGTSYLSHTLYEKTNKEETNDWLFSPTFYFEKDKIYRLKFHYSFNSLSTIYNNKIPQIELSVKASNKGILPTNFTKEVIKKQVYNASIYNVFNTEPIASYLDLYINNGIEYKMKKAFISDLVGDVNIGWHITKEITDTILTNFLLDNVFVEEVVNCPEPYDIKIDEIEKDKITISWKDDFDSIGWEYFIQKEKDTSKVTKGVPTKSKINVVTTDYLGNRLEPNTIYKVFVRTKCLNGEYSIWSESISFVTGCRIYTVPFFEGFNKNSLQYLCWSILDFKGEKKSISIPWILTDYDFSEGNQAINFANIYSSREGDNNRETYLISPTIKLKTGKYILKYQYRNVVSKGFENEHRVALSTSGISKNDFQTIIVTPINEKTNNFKEITRFFDIAKDSEVNMAWVSNVLHTDSSNLMIDDIRIEKVENCAEPYNIRTTNLSTNSVTIAWDQIDNASSWEVSIFERGKSITSTPINTINVVGTPMANITGLMANKAYTIYIRTKCIDGTSMSNWSSPFTISPINRLNDECFNAVNIPVNNGYECYKKVEGTLVGSTLTSQPPLSNCNRFLKNDIWFEFTATSTELLLNLLDFESKVSDIVKLDFILYNQPCNNITFDMGECFELSKINTIHILKNLIPNGKYYLRVGSDKIEKDVFFSLCLTTPKYLYATTNQSVENLVKEVLLNKNCGLVSNVTSKTGTDYGFDNGIAHFSVNSPYFSFKEGVMLATNGIQYAKGPSEQEQGSLQIIWPGDEDLKTLFNKYQYFNLDDNSNAVYTINNSSIIEFDFIPLSNTISFDFLMASNDYRNFVYIDNNGSSSWEQKDVIGFFLTDKKTEETKNIAVVPETSVPIFSGTITPKYYLNSNAPGRREFRQHFDNLFVNKEKIYTLEQDGVVYKGNFSSFLPKEWNSVNYRGVMKSMRAKSTVVPGRKYHLKLAIGNYGKGSHSAVFFNKGSLDITSFSLGDDLLIETNTALCANETHTIESHLSDDKTKVSIKWYKDEEELIGEDEPNLIVKEAGVYKIVAKFLEYDCESKGELKVEVYPLISSIVKQPKDISACKTTIQPTGIDLTPAVNAMFENTGLTDYDYIITYYEDTNGTKQIKDPKNYITDQRENKKIYLLFKDPNTSCIEKFEFNLSFVEGEKPKARETVNACNSYTLPKVEANQAYYTEFGGKGVRYKEGDVLGIGKYDMYVLQENGNNCYEEVMFKIEVGKTPELQIIEDVVLSCKLYAIPVAWPHNKFYIEKDGKREEVVTGTSIVKNNTKVYVVATSPNGACVDEISFVVRYEDCPIPKGISPNGDGMNDTFDLTLHGVTSIKIFNRLGTEVYSFAGHYTDQWDGKDKKGKALPSGTYYYVIQSFDKARTGWVEISK